MPIEKGGSWGHNATLPAGSPIASTDTEGRLAIESAWKLGTEIPIIGLAGGDLCRTVGGRGDLERFTSDAAQLLPCDAIHVAVDDAEFIGIAHCVIRRRWLVGAITAVMNAAWMGEWNVAPRSHPGDGRLDVVTATTELGPMDRLRARSRLPHGGHVPHSAIRQTRVTPTTALTLELDRPTPVYVDSERIGSGQNIVVSVLPDFFTAGV